MSKIEIKRNKLVGMNAKILIMGTIVYALLLVALATVQAGVIDVGDPLESIEASSNNSMSRSTFTTTPESRRAVTSTPTQSQNRSMSTFEPGPTVTPAPTQLQNRSTPTPEPEPTVTLTPTPIRASIQAPITTAHTQPTAFLEEEAGIVAYTNTGQKIDLTKVKNIFKTVDKETDTYLIGTIVDMQAFVHEDGCIAVYYLKDEPIGKIVDPEDYGEKIISTKLERELARICDAAEVGLPYVKHYNFKYPNANKLRIITESVTNVKGYDSNTFDVKIPGDFTVYERSWLHYQYWEYEPESYMIYNLKSEIEIDEDTINSMPQHTATKYGQITPSHLLPDIFHTVGLYVSNYHPSGFRWIGDDKGFIAIIIG